MGKDDLQNIDPIGHLHNLVREHPDFEVLCEPTLNDYCFRYVPTSWAERRGEPEVQRLINCLNEEIVTALQHNKSFPLVTMRVRGQTAIRVSICADKTLKADVDDAFEAIAQWADCLRRTVSHKLTSDREAQLC